MRMSIVLPVYGVERYIQKCAISIFSQLNMREVECIFVNDATKDNSMTILREVMSNYPSIQDKIRIIEHEQNHGLAAARLTGLLAAKGDYVWFVDSDDWIESNAVDTILQSLSDNPDALYFNHYDNYDNQQFMNNDNYYPTLINCLCLRLTLCLWRMVVKRDIYIKNNCLPISGIDMSEDVILHSRIRYYLSSILVLRTPLYHYRRDNENSLVNNVGINQINQISQGLVIVNDFYKSKKASKQIQRCLAYRALITYMMIIKSKSNISLKITVQDILKENSSFLAQIVNLCNSNIPIITFVSRVYRKYLIKS